MKSLIIVLIIGVILFGLVGVLEVVAPSGDLLLIINNPTPQNGDLFGYSVASTPNGNIIVGDFSDNTDSTDAGSVSLFDGTTGDLLFTINNPTLEDFDGLHNNRLGHSVASTPNGNIIVGSPTAGTTSSGSAYLFDGTTGDLLLTIRLLNC